MLKPEQIKDRILTIIQLPTLPTVAMEVVDMVDNPRASASMLGKLISTDQALTAKVLKIANSPFYGFPRRISTIDFAIIVLGCEALKEIVISISLVSSLQRKSDRDFDAKVFWDHAISSGILARRLGRELDYRITGEVFVGGLLHDMGISILHRYFPGEYARIADIIRNTELTALEAEESVLGLTHATVGGWLAERWNLPEHLVEAIRFHHTPGLAEKNGELVSIIHAADVFAHRLSEHPADFDKGILLDEKVESRLRAIDPQFIEQFTAGQPQTADEDVEDSGKGRRP